MELAIAMAMGKGDGLVSGSGGANEMKGGETETSSLWPSLSALAWLRLWREKQREVKRVHTS